MTTDLQLESQSWAAQQDDAGEEMLTRDLDAELAEANASYEAWLLTLPRESCGQWNESDTPLREWTTAEMEALLPAPF